MAWFGFYWLRMVAGEGSCGGGTGFHVNGDFSRLPEEKV
jgi:hypothetical protein